MTEKRIDVPFVSPPMFRMIINILKSHEENGITIIDKMEIEKIYVTPPDAIGEVKKNGN